MKRRPGGPPAEEAPKPVAEPQQRAALVGSDAWLFERTRARPDVGLTSVEILDLVYGADDE